MPSISHQSSKNIVQGSITAGGNVHIGDRIYIAERDFQHSTLFLRIELAGIGENTYTACLYVRLQHPEKDFPEENPDIPLTEPVAVDISTQLFERLELFQQTRRFTGDTFRLQGRIIPPIELYQEENALIAALFQAFFSDKVGETCARFIELLDKQKLRELLLVISTDEERVMNLPWEMVIAQFFHGEAADAAHSLSVNTFGLVRSKEKSLAAFDIRGKNPGAAPLKMLFVTALPENMGERDKLLEIEDEQRKLIQAVGNLEATGSQPKIVIEFLDNASLAEIETALIDRGHDILHISGHGAYLEHLEKGVLYMEDEFGDELKIAGKELGSVLHRHKSLKLLILSACETAIARKDGVVEQISAKSGIPAILAMRFAVTDEGAKLFTTALYYMLAKGESVTHAVAHAREVLWQKVAEKRKVAPDVYHIAEWFTPVLYLNQFVGAIVDVRKEYLLPDDFYPRSRFEPGERSRFIGQGFIGRKRYLIWLRKCFAQDKHVCLHGLGGMGKTTLAEAFVRNYRNRALKVLKFTGREINIASLLERIYQHFCTLPRVEEDEGLKKEMASVKDNQDIKPIERLGRLLRSCLDPNGTIFLFDNFEDVQTSGEGELQREINGPELLECLRYLCENTPENCHVLFTTRYKITELEDEITHIPLDKLTYAEQYRLMNFATHPKKGNPFDKLGMSQRETVIRRLDGHPRAYEFLESLLRKDRDFNWEKLEATLGKTERQVLESLLLEKIYAKLTEEEKAVFQVASVFISRSPLAALEYVYKNKPVKKQSFFQNIFQEKKRNLEVDYVRAINGLSEWSLCNLDENDDFEIHLLTRQWANKTGILSKGDIKNLSLCAANYIGTLMSPDGMTKISNGLLERTYCEMAESWDRYGDLTGKLQQYFMFSGFWNNAIELNREMLEKNVSNNLNFQALNHIGMILLKLREMKQANQVFLKAMEICKTTGDLKQEATILNNLSEIYRHDLKYEDARKCLLRSLDIMRQIKDKHSEGYVLSSLSETMKHLNDFKTAYEYGQESIKIRRDLGDKAGLSTCLINMANLFMLLGDNNNALIYFDESESLMKTTGNLIGLAGVWVNSARIHISKKNFEKARMNAMLGLTISQQIGDKYTLSTSYSLLGEIEYELGDSEKSLTYHYAAYEIGVQLDDIVKISQSLNHIGVVHHSKKDYEKAIEFYTKSLSYKEFSRDIPGIATIKHNIGNVFFEQGQFEEAIPFFLESFEINQSIGSTAAEHQEMALFIIIKKIGKEKFEEVKNLSYQKALQELKALENAVAKAKDTKDMESMMEMLKLLRGG
jgi:tetratricopeptide (TPR) repeat protein